MNKNNSILLKSIFVIIAIVFMATNVFAGFGVSVGLASESGTDCPSPGSFNDGWNYNSNQVGLRIPASSFDIANKKLSVSFLDSQNDIDEPVYITVVFVKPGISDAKVDREVARVMYDRDNSFAGVLSTYWYNKKYTVPGSFANIGTPIFYGGSYGVKEGVVSGSLDFGNTIAKIKKGTTVTRTFELNTDGSGSDRINVYISRYYKAVEGGKLASATRITTHCTKGFWDDAWRKLSRVAISPLLEGAGVKIGFQQLVMPVPQPLMDSGCIATNTTFVNSHMYYQASESCMFSAPNVEAGYYRIKLSTPVTANSTNVKDNKTEQEIDNNNKKDSESQPQNSVPEFTVNLKEDISDVKYSLTGNNTQYPAKKINDPKMFLIDYKDKAKTVYVNLNLPQFTAGDIYIINVNDKSKENSVTAELNRIASSGEFTTDYTVYASSNLFKINSTNKLELNKLKYTLDNTKTFKFEILENLETTSLFFIIQKSGNTINISVVIIDNIDYRTQSTYQQCLANKKILSFYCNGFDCDLSKISCLNAMTIDTAKIEQITTPPKTTTTTFTGKCSIDKQTTLEKYIACLRSNIETVDLTKKYDLVIDGKEQNQARAGNILIDDKYITNNTNLCFTSEKFNNTIFSVAKANNLTEEETAQLWSRVAGESGCKVEVCSGYTCESQGVAQINVNAWKNSYSVLSKYLKEIDSVKYATEAKYKVELENVSNTPSTAIEISIAINKYHKSAILNKSANATRPFLDNMDKIYDADDAIDMEFATAYVYQGISYADHFSDGIKIGTTRWQGIVYTSLHKMGYYLSYKRMIYNCHKEVTTNAFVTAYKTKYSGTYCK